MVVFFFWFVCFAFNQGHIQSHQKGDGDSISLQHEGILYEEYTVKVLGTAQLFHTQTCGPEFDLQHPFWGGCLFCFVFKAKCDNKKAGATDRQVQGQ